MSTIKMAHKKLFYNTCPKQYRRPNDPPNLEPSTWAMTK
jgi:hypothetical protein